MDSCEERSNLTRFRRSISLGFALALVTLFAHTLPAASFNVTPASVSNSYTGYISFQIGGLTNGETVVVQEYFDVNGNGRIDAGDILGTQFQLTDGQSSVVCPGVTNINVPGDTTPADGAITARLLFENNLSFAGTALFRLSSPVARFSPLTNQFTIIPTPYPQSFTGHVLSSGTNVPNASVLLVLPGAGPRGSTVSDSSGAFTLPAPVGTWSLIAVKSNYVADGSVAANLVLTAGATINTNVILLPATRNISGRVQDANNPSLGLAGLVVPVQSKNNNNTLVVAFTDVNGNFNAPVTSDVWKIQTAGSQLNTYGYLRLGNSPRVDTSTGSVANVTLALPKANCVFYGRVKDGNNNPLYGVQLNSRANDDSYSGEGILTDTNGNYVAGALGPGIWEIQVSGDGNPAFSNYIFSVPDFQQNNGTNITAGQCLRQDFTALLANRHITGWLKDGSGNPLAGVSVNANATINGVTYQSQANTDTNGNYSLPVVDGDWNVSICCGCNNCGNNCLSGNYCCPNNNGQTVHVSGSDQTDFFTATIAGQLQIASSSPLPGAQVGTFYSFQFEGASCQQFLNWSSGPTNPPSGLTLDSGGTLSGTPDTAGTYVFNVNVSDGIGGFASGVFSITVQPGAGCTLICPNNITVPAAQGQCGAIVTFSQPTTIGVCGNTTCTPPSGSFFTVGTTNVMCTNDAGASCSFMVTVQDTQRPTITCPANIVLAADSGQCSRANVTFSVGASDNCGSPNVVSTPPSGSTFPVGITTVTNVATDNSANQSVCTFTVTITNNLTQPPTMSCPGNMNLAADSGHCSKSNVIFSVSATNQCGGPVPVVSAPPSGSAFPVGLTTVTNTATDTSGNTSICIFTVTVTDTQSPVITCPSNIVLAADLGQCSRSNVIFIVTANDNCGPANVVSVPPSGSTFPVGVTTVTNTATDSHNNTSLCTFTVTVQDTQAPIIACPGNIVLAADPGQCSHANVTFNVSALDNCDGTVNVLSVPASGSTFPVGVTTVTNTAHDSHGNTNVCTFTVTIQDTNPPIVTLNGAAVMTNECHTAFTDLGATASDNCAATLPVITNSTVNANATGTYTISYVATDGSGNSTTNSRTVYIVDTTAPVVTVLGSTPAFVLTNTSFVDLGATATDTCAGLLPVATNSTVDITTAGTYTITYSAMDGSGNTGSAQRTVNVVTNLLAIFASQPSSIVTNAGAAVSFSVVAAGYNLTYQWCKNGAPLGDSNNVSGSATSTLTLSNVLRADDGPYLVKVSNSLGTTNSDAATLAVNDPVILSGPDDQSVLSGGSAAFSVTAAGTPPLAYQWYSSIGAKTTKLAGKTSATLSLAPASTSMGGDYFAVVTANLSAPNTVTSSTAHLSVYLKPTITITTPKANQTILTNGLLAVGTASDNVAVDSVWYQLNAGPWTQANGTTSWSVPNLLLTPGLNTLSVYSLAFSNVVSPTKTVSFKYIITQPLSLTISPSNTWGMVNPNYNNKPLQLGAKYVMNAQASHGFAFAGWTSNGISITSPSHLSFVMSSNLFLTANFADAQAPVCAITNPAVSHTVSNSPIIAVIKAKDNVGVTAVSYNLNSNGWASATSSDGIVWYTASLDLTPGANSLAAFAQDAAGKQSLINTVQFKYSPPPFHGLAPTSLAGLVGVVTGATDDLGDLLTPFRVSFGVSTFAVRPADTSNNPKLGNYTYTVLSSNTAQFVRYSVAPPDQTGDTKELTLTFTNSNTCIADTNQLGDPITITFSPAPVSQVPSPSASLIIAWSDDLGGTGTNVLAGGMFTNTTSDGTMTWGTYTLEQFSPNVALQVATYTDPNDIGATDYSESTFTSANAGTYFNTRIDILGNPSVNTGSFTILSSTMPSAGTAPTSLAGKLVTVSPPGQTRFTLTFGDYTWSQFDPDTTAQNTALGDYTYMKTGPNTAQLIMIKVIPDQQTITNAHTVNLTFTSSTTGTGGENHSPFTVASASDLAPTSLAGKTGTDNSNGGTARFNSDGTVTFSKNGQSNTESYTYAKFSPDGGLWIYVDGDGNTEYTLLRFTSTSGGSAYSWIYDPSGNFLNAKIFSFSLK